MPLLNPKQFEEDHLEKIRALEKELDLVVVAFEPQLRPATLSEEPLDRLRAAERELSAVLIALDAHSVNVVTGREHNGRQQ
jgi:hypothetical protein